MVREIYIKPSRSGKKSTVVQFSLDHVSIMNKLACGNLYWKNSLKFHLVGFGSQ